MSTETTTPKKKGPLANAFERIMELENKLAELDKPHSCPAASLVALPRRRMYTGRVNLPNFGQALPKGVGYHDYVTVRLDDDVINEVVTPPTEEDVMIMLEAQANLLFPGHQGVNLSDISELPDGWE